MRMIGRKLEGKWGLCREGIRLKSLITEHGRGNGELKWKMENLEWRGIRRGGWRWRGECWGRTLFRGRR